jgi:DnaJ-class molecular chaperone
MRTQTKPKRGFMDGYKTYDTSNGFGNARRWRDGFYEKMSSEDAAKIIKSQDDTPYFILGIPENASAAEIKKAFRELIMKWHPDKNQDNIEEAELMSKKIIAAYTILD